MNCSCHDELAYWDKDARRPDGGYWRCAVDKREREVARYHDPRNAEAVLRKRMGEYARKHRRRLTRLQEDFGAEVPAEE